MSPVRGKLMAVNATHFYGSPFADIADDVPIEIKPFGIFHIEALSHRVRDIMRELD
jgi:hypothetical protein